MIAEYAALRLSSHLRSLLAETSPISTPTLELSLFLELSTSLLLTTLPNHGPVLLFSSTSKVQALVLSTSKFPTAKIKTASSKAITSNSCCLMATSDLPPLLSNLTLIVNLSQLVEPTLLKCGCAMETVMNTDLPVIPTPLSMPLHPPLSKLTCPTANKLGLVFVCVIPTALNPKWIENLPP